MKRLKTVLSAFLFLAGLGGLCAQEAVSSSGGLATGAGGTAGFTIGQVAYQSHAGVNGSAWQGVQQSYEISDISGIAESSIQLELAAYPNPTTDLLYLKVKNSDERQMVYNLYDMQGKLLLSEKILENVSTINMANYFPSTYILSIQDTKSNKKLKTIQIIKK